MMYPQAFRTDTQRFPGRKSLIAAAVLATLPLAPGAIAQEGLVLEEVIVTARKREENLQDTPVSITAVSGAMINQAKLLRVEGKRAKVLMECGI